VKYSPEEILKAIANEKSLILFKTIAVRADKDSSDISITKLKLTRKQYYSRLSNLMKTGLVEKRGRKYSLTSLGKLVYGAHALIESALDNHSKLVVIDSLLERNLSEYEKISKEEFAKLVDNLIDNCKIRDILGDRA
jgi:predicted transcriptional regulator